MNLTSRAVSHISEIAKIPSFSTYEERLHPYIRAIFNTLPTTTEIEVPGNNLIFRLGNNSKYPPVALAAHLDKINHFGVDYPDELPVEASEDFIEGAMDDSAGLGILLALAEVAGIYNFPDTLFFFSEMEESKGFKEHPHLLKNNGEGYESGRGARRISRTCINKGLIPEQIITIDTTPLFRGNSGIAIYSRHWEINNTEPSGDLLEATGKVVENILSTDREVQLENNTNDYLHYGKFFNRNSSDPVVSIALEPAIYPYHQKGEKVYVKDIDRLLKILVDYISSSD